MENMKHVNALDILTIMLNARICANNCIVGDGDCFFHALEVAIGNCSLIPEGKIYTRDEDKKKYRTTRQEVSKQPMIQAMIEEKKNKRKELIDSLEGPPDPKNPNKVLDVEKVFAEIQELENQKTYFENFGKSYAYADDFIIQQTAIYKKKILLIVQESDTDPLIVFIHPKGVDLEVKKSMNVVVLLRKGGNTQHYISFDDFPLNKDRDFMKMLIDFEKYEDTDKFYIEPEEEEKGVFVKHASLKNLLCFLEKKKLDSLIKKQNQMIENKTKREQTNHKSKNKLTLNLRKESTNNLIKQIQEQDKKDEERNAQEKKNSNARKLQEKKNSNFARQIHEQEKKNSNARKLQEKKNSNFARQIHEQEEAFRLITQESTNEEIARLLQEDEEQIQKKLKDEEEYKKSLEIIQQKQKEKLMALKKEEQKRKDKELEKLWKRIKKGTEPAVSINTLVSKHNNSTTETFGGTRKRKKKMKKKTIRKSSRRKSIKLRRSYRSR
jgi:hypothetical protein